MVGQKLVDELVRLHEVCPWQVTVIGDEPVAAYDRVALSTWFDGASVQDLSLRDDSAMEAAGIDYRLGTRVDRIDRSQRRLITDIGEPIQYDHLVLATGSIPFVPPIEGRDAEGCFVYRTLHDLQRIRAWAEGRHRGVVVGGGLLGLEAANALQNLGLETHVVEMADRLMPQQLDGPAAAMLERWVSELGVVVHTSFATDRIEVDDGRVAGCSRPTCSRPTCSRPTCLRPT